MKKDERQLLIREIIQHEKLSTQKDIQDRLDQRPPYPGTYEKSV